MDDDLVLNLTADNQLSSKSRSGNKGGRWTDRLKAKRVAKRKTRPYEKLSASATNVSTGELPYRPAKRARKDTFPSTSRPIPAPRPVQIISSLFSYNPKVEAPVLHSSSQPVALPSNAPLADLSSFTALGLNPLIVAHLDTKMKINKPTSIQRSALPAFLLESSSEMSIRDIFIQSQTGSGKTLSFLLPIIQDLLPMSSLSYIDRSIGTLAIIIVPTRELAKQISDVLEELLQLRLRPRDEFRDDQDTLSPRLTRWLVSGVLTGGATRAHEKARLRKGLPILVSTPGRLLDHLQNTSSFNVGKCRWLVLDEADRLMELGFEETISGIIQGLDGRRNLALKAIEEGKSLEVGGWDWDRRRRTVLCSATIREDVQKLAGKALMNPLMIKATEVGNPSVEVPTSDDNDQTALPSPETFTPPTQLVQKFVVVPLKLRLVVLVALLRSLLAQSQGRHRTKIIVFFSCTDSVDFHWSLFGKSGMEDEKETSLTKGDRTIVDNETMAVTSPLLPDTSIYRLHGSLPTSTRLASLHGFSTTTRPDAQPSSAILLCTSVASRGLDLPLVRAVVQYDLPTEGGATEYVHRVGRTARTGKGGEAWSIVSPSETEWVKWVEGKMRGEEKDIVSGDAKRNIALTGVGMETILKGGFGGVGNDFEKRATDVQLSFERWVLRNKENTSSAHCAFLSHMRAYATHPSNEKHIFHIRHLHIGHLAKSFALRDAPTTVTGGNKSGRKPYSGEVKDQKVRTRGEKWDLKNGGEAEKRMQAIVRTQGRLTKKEGVMMSSGSSEFQIAGGSMLEKLVRGSRST
ncbi:P-loop containing nucleoside triphosphate hydrolase protein [Collybia nuda]|uniref:ATP-dependent RNA helicase n=1 Tax=Collybia nuda TaxID=64659 RepID=A0A9P6CKF9_9AGAR|nr:P-loop containing nucleoside triphosphate hydrolase protein [Collybia nuda]